MERISLEALKRAEGKGKAKEARRNSLIPGILYGKGCSPIAICVKEKELEKVVKTKAGMNVLFDLSIEGKEKVVARIREYQANPIKRNFTHVDFQVIDLTKKITVEVPILFEGKSIGVKEGGVLVMDRRALEVKCLPNAIPQNISVDISILEIGDGIHINDLKLPEGVECPRETNFAIVSVVAPMKEEVVAPVAEVVTIEGAAAPAAGAAPGAAVGTAPAAAPAAPTAGAAGTKPTTGVKPAPGAAKS